MEAMEADMAVTGVMGAMGVTVRTRENASFNTINV